MADNNRSEPLVWDDKPSAAWRAAVNAWPWKPNGEGEWLKSGNCPHCGHHMEVLGTITLSISEFAAGNPPEAPEPVHARCDCGEPHPNRPALLKAGCGKTGEIDPPKKA